MIKDEQIYKNEIMNAQNQPRKSHNTRGYHRLYYHTVINELGSKTCPHCGNELLCQSSLVKRQDMNQKCKMQRMKRENEQQKQTDTPPLEECIDEPVPQNNENDMHEATTNDTNPIDVEQVDNPLEERESNNLEIHSDIDVSNLTPTESSTPSHASADDSNPLVHIDFQRVLSKKFKQVLRLSYQLQDMKIVN